MAAIRSPTHPPAFLPARNRLDESTCRLALPHYQRLAGTEGPGDFQRPFPKQPVPATRLLTESVLCVAERRSHRQSKPTFRASGQAMQRMRHSHRHHREMHHWSSRSPACLAWRHQKALAGTTINAASMDRLWPARGLAATRKTQAKRPPGSVATCFAFPVRRCRYQRRHPLHCDQPTSSGPMIQAIAKSIPPVRSCTRVALVRC